MAQYDDEEEVWDIVHLEELATPEQLAKVRALEQFGWRACFLFEYRVGLLGVWMIVRSRQTVMSKSNAFLHTHVRVDGSSVAYKP